MNPEITVLMPVYNGEKYLFEAIESVLNQKFKNFELLIVNDGSTDNSENIARSFSDKRVRIINNEQNLGLTTTLNRGIELSNGKYIARMDSDDISLPDRLTLQHDFLERHPEIAMCGSAVKVMGTGQIWRYSQDPHELKCELLFGCCFAHPTVMIRRRVFSEIGFRYDPSCQHAEDYDLWVRMSKTLLLSNLPVPLLFYRFHHTQVSKVYGSQQSHMARNIQRKQLWDLGIHPTESQLNMHFNIWRYYNTRQFREWLQILLKANLERGVYPHDVFYTILSKYCSDIRR